MKKVVCLHNVYFEGRYIKAGIAASIPDDVADNWVKRGLAKPVAEETPVNPPAVPPEEKPAVPPVENPDEKSDLPPEGTPEGTGVVKLEDEETTEVTPDEKADLKYDFTTPIPATVPEENAVVKQDFTTEQSNSVIKENLTTENDKVEESPVVDDDAPKRGRPPKKKNGEKG